jgi:hypothetical protein
MKRNGFLIEGTGSYIYIHEWVSSRSLASPRPSLNILLIMVGDLRDMMYQRV